MPFGLSNVLISFLKYINKILIENQDIFIIMYFNHILVFTENLGQPHMGAIYWVFKQLWKQSFFANLKKCCFYQEEVRFLSFVVLAKGIKIEEKRIKAIKTWPEL